MRKLGNPKKKSKGRPKNKTGRKQVPNLVKKGLARKRFHWFGRLIPVKAKPENKKPATLKDLKRLGAEAKRLAAEAGKYATGRERLATMSKQLAATKKRTAADRKIIKAVEIRRSEIMHRAKTAKKNLPTAQATAEIRKLTSLLVQLARRVKLARARLAVHEPREQELIKKLRALSKENRALGKKLGLDQ